MKKVFVLFFAVIPFIVFANIISFGLGGGAVQYNGNWSVNGMDFELADMGYRGGITMRLTPPIIPIDIDIYGNYDWIPEINAQSIATLGFNQMKSYSFGANLRYRFHIPPWVNVYTTGGLLQQTYWYEGELASIAIETDKETSLGALFNMGVEFFIPTTKMSFDIEGGFKALFKSELPYELFLKVDVFFGII